MWIDEVTGILVDAAEEVILPRFRALGEGEVIEKAPGDLVTVADREAEQLIGRRLRGVVDAPVVGEEAVGVDPGLLGALREAPEAWVVDPLDGTANFVAGRVDFAVMAALVRGGEAVAAWLVLPVEGRVYAAERGAGTWRDGARVHRKPASADVAALRGVALSKYFDPERRARVEAAGERFAEFGSGIGSAGVEYAQLVDGDVDFVLFHRTLPWDHTPGALLLSEAGGCVRRPDDSPYRPSETRPGLLAAADRECWGTVRSLLLR